MIFPGVVHLPEINQMTHTTIYAIHTFDDGNDRHLQYPNRRYIASTWRGKARLQNVACSTVYVPSISLWRLRCLTPLPDVGRNA